MMISYQATGLIIILATKLVLFVGNKLNVLNTVVIKIGPICWEKKKKKTKYVE